MEIDFKITKDVKSKMQQSIYSLNNLLNNLRTGRASVNLLDSVKVEINGTDMLIKKLGSITISSGRIITIQVWNKSLVSYVEKGILNSGLGLTPNIEGQFIKLYVPSLSESRRKQLIKKANEYAEQTKISVRAVRRSLINILKKQQKEKVISLDNLKSNVEEIQKITNFFIDKIDKILAIKSKDIMTI